MLQGQFLNKPQLQESTIFSEFKTKIVLKVAKETTSIEMPNYVGSTYDFARSNLIEIYGIKEANIELRKTEHLPDGVVVSAGQIVSQTPEVSSTVDINRTRIVFNGI